MVINELYKILLYVGDNVIVRGRQCYCTWRTITTKKDHKNQNKTSFLKINVRIYTITKMFFTFVV